MQCFGRHVADADLEPCVLIVVMDCIIVPDGAPVIERATQNRNAPSPPACSPRQDLSRAVAALRRRTFQVTIKGRGRVRAQALGERLEQVVTITVGRTFIRRESIQEGLESIAD